MSDLDLGMNTWMSHTFAYPDAPLDRGKVLDESTLKQLGEWGRYRDVDGDGIPYRTIPGTGGPAYFTRGSGHNEKGQYSERRDNHVHDTERLTRKFASASAQTITPTTWRGGLGNSRPRATTCRNRFSPAIWIRTLRLSDTEAAIGRSKKAGTSC